MTTFATDLARRGSVNLTDPSSGLSPLLASCQAAEMTIKYFVPWTDLGAAGRWLCHECLMTVWQVDTQAEGDVRRQGRRIRPAFRRRSIA